MTIDEQYLIQLRDCFTAGYTLPQFCVDQDIKKPLIVGMNESQIKLLWEIHVQFQYDRRLLAEFALIKGSAEKINFALETSTISDLNLKNVSELDTDNYDRVVILAVSNNFNKRVFYLNQVTHFSYNRVHADIPLLNFIQKNPGVKVIQLTLPILKKNSTNNDAEREILKRIESGERVFIGNIRKEIEIARSKGETIPTPYDFLGYSNEKVYNLLEDPGRKINIDGSVWLNDNKFLNIEHGKRLTAYQPKYYKNTIYFVGNCVLFGYGVPWNRTVESHLQKLLNEKNLPYCVENASQFTVKKRQDTFYILDKLQVKSGDIIFVMLGALAENVPLLDASSILDRPHNYGEVFPDIPHINELGHKALADYIFKVLVSNNFFKDTDFKYPPPPPPISQIWHTKRKFNIPAEFFTKCRVGRVQEKIA